MVISHFLGRVTPKKLIPKSLINSTKLFCKIIYHRLEKEKNQSSILTYVMNVISNMHMNQLSYYHLHNEGEVMPLSSKHHSFSPTKVSCDYLYTTCVLTIPTILGYMYTAPTTHGSHVHNK